MFLKEELSLTMLTADAPRILVSSLMSPMAETTTAASVRKSLLFIDDGIAFHPTYGDRGENINAQLALFPFAGFEILSWC